MPEATFKELFEKFLHDNMTPAEVRRFQAMANDRKNKRSLDRLLREAYRSVPSLQSARSEASGGEINELFQQVMLKARLEEAGNIPSSSGRIIQIYRRYHVAIRSTAAILCIAFIGVSSYRIYINETTSPLTVIHAGIGERKSLTLPDGSKVILNAGSTLTLNGRFNTEGRAVALTGEAYFDVARNVRMPFVIHISSMDIKVLGTAFNVRAYPEEATDVASLINGKIEVTLKQGTGQPGRKEYYLSPLQKITVDKAQSAVALSGGDMPGQTKATPEIDSLRVSRLVAEIPETAWTDNKLFFNAEPLNQVMTKIEKWYGVSVRLDNEAIGNLHFTGSYQDESLEDVMEAIELSNPEVHYRIENGGKLLVLY